MQLTHHKKILIIGSAGSGKTTLSKKLNKKLSLPIIHLDKYYWRSNWQCVSNDEWEKIIEKFSNQKTWIMDGNYSKTIATRLQYADVVIFLDIPRYICLLRVILRRFKFSSNKTRVDIPQDCKERMSFEFYKWIWNFPKRSRPGILELLESTSKTQKTQVIILKNSTQINEFIANLT